MCGGTYHEHKSHDQRRETPRSEQHTNVQKLSDPGTKQEEEDEKEEDDKTEGGEQDGQTQPEAKRSSGKRRLELV